MLRAAHTLPDRFAQVGEITFDKSYRKWAPAMANAIGIKSGELDAYMHAPWPEEQVDQLHLFLAGLLDGAMAYHGHRGNFAMARDIDNLSAQYRAPRHRPVIERPDTSGLIHEDPAGPAPALDLSGLPEWEAAAFAELMADD